MDAQLEKVAEWLGRAERCLVFTGAGVSTESGIPDFRSPGGVWSRTKPILFEEYRRDGLAQLEYWRQRTETHLQFADAQPNTAHRVFARWEADGRIRGVITQNIDGLHQIAGSRNVLELHGTGAKSAASIAARSSMRRRWSRGSSKRRPCLAASGAGD